MVELVKYMVDHMVSSRDDVNVTLDNDTIFISVNKDDMGKVIGKQGRIAKAIRTIVKVAAAKEGKNYTVEIVEKS